MEFNAIKEKENIVKWIQNFFEVNGKDCNAVIGISGGKDSSVAAALCVEALGKDRVIGVLMPNGEQADIDMSLLLVNHFNIRYTIVNIKEPYDSTIKAIIGSDKHNLEFEISKQTQINLAPRLRMSTLYAVSQSLNGRVVNTCNKSEDWVGYSTRYGDAAGDFSPLSSLTVNEVKQIGKACGLPTELIEKAPSDGLTGKTDEDNLGFTYEMLDAYIRTGIINDKEKKELIDRKHRLNKFKLELMPYYDSKLPVKADD